MTKAAHPLPNAGGSYLRDANGTLMPQAERPEAQAASQPEKPATKPAAKAHKEG